MRIYLDYLGYLDSSDGIASMLHTASAEVWNMIQPFLREVLSPFSTSAGVWSHFYSSAGTMKYHLTTSAVRLNRHVPLLREVLNIISPLLREVLRMILSNLQEVWSIIYCGKYRASSYYLYL